MLAGEQGKQRFKGFPAEQGRAGQGHGGLQLPDVITSPAEVGIQGVGKGMPGAGAQCCFS